MRYNKVMTPNHFHHQQKEVARRSNIRELVFGAQDGLISTIGLVAGVYAVTANNKFVIITGLIEVLTGALSMSLGAYLSAKAESQIYQREQRGQAQEQHLAPRLAQHELLHALRHDGLSLSAARLVLKILQTSASAFTKTFRQKVLGFCSATAHQPGRSAIVMAISFILGGLVPLLAFLFWQGDFALYIAVALTATALFGIGVYKAWLAQISRWRSGLEFLGFALAITALGHLIGVAIRALL